MIDVFFDALFDSLKILPIVFIVYVLIEYVEAKEATKRRMNAVFASKYSPFFGSAIGLIPQCGFSVVATKLYLSDYIYLGTLLSIYFATSDEAVPIMFSRALSNPSLFQQLFLLIFLKFIYAIAVGFIINLILKKIKKTQTLQPIKPVEHEDGCCGHSVEGERADLKQLIIHPFFHSLKIIMYVFIVNFVLGFVIDVIVGKEVFYAFLSQSTPFQPLFAVLVGIIPNCASSVVLTEIYIEGALSFGGLIAGLTANSGLGVAILVKDRKKLKSLPLVLLLIFTLSLLIGYLTLPIKF